MEPVGLAVGGVGLVGLFSTCVNCFELVQNGRYLGRDYILLETKFDNLRLRFRSWGRACGFMDSGRYDVRLDNQEIKSSIESTMANLIHLFQNGSQLQEKYGLKDEWKTSMIVPQNDAPGLNILSSSITTGSWLGTTLDRLKHRIESTKKRASLGRTARWAIEDKTKFEELITHLRDLIEDLERMTQWEEIIRQQHRALQREIDSICEVEQLEAFEEARLGHHDIVSRAASLRLSRTQTRITTFEDKSGSASIAPYRSPQAIPNTAIESDWHDFAQDMREPIKHVGPTTHLELNSVECEGQPETSCFDTPEYKCGMRAIGDWVLLPNSESPGQLHLSGQKVFTISDPSFQKDHIHFILSKHFLCDHSDSHFLGETPKYFKVSVQLLSEELCLSLNSLPDWCRPHLDAGLKSGVTLHSPFLWHYHGRRKIARYLDHEPLSCLISLLDSVMAEEYAAVDRLLRKNAINWHYISYIFIPGEVVVRHAGADTRNAEGYELTSWARPEPAVLTLSVSCLALDDKPKRHDFSITLPLFEFHGIEEKMSIRDLPISPLKYLRVGIRHSLCRRATILANFKDRRLFQYKESKSNRNYCMLDPATYALVHRSTAKTSEIRVTIFNFKTRLWETVNVSQLQPATWDDGALELCWLKQSTKDSLLAICGAQMKKETPGKRGEATMLVFYGASGTGKSFVVEGLAQHLRKPLMHLPATGSSVEQLEQYLTMGQIWDVIYTIDCPVYSGMKTATKTGIERSSLKTLLRRMTQIQGTLIVESSTADLGSDVLSRANLLVYFPVIGNGRRLDLWVRALKQNDLYSEQDFNAADGSIGVGFKRSVIAKLVDIDLNPIEIEKVISNSKRVAAGLEL
ncbi:hypothetical protein JX265_000323 [Neoarthrinium moseri]|uniref:Prion-inhibition and propagation HeLo domain-containing protein n=1 Tax=Neoarthrinium moseri TaxID=1658444 RepID=A0A9P9WYB3_9PEZI|nr:uncharacterized protein JN550_000573 [Neoarthrinium moseri]KAI1878391.1 hypothetical protein JN550_000573 [Neoarthrinium moseri]KAI1881497.1 hypothetical protein JX265_000323 [Neoarthrinium moseri]